MPAATLISPRLKSEPNVNFISRNLLFGCKNVFLRDGGGQKATLLSLSEDAAPPELTATGKLRAPNGRRALFEAIPVAEMGPYQHPWRASPLPER